MSQPRFRSEDEPDGERRRSHREDDRHEDAADPIGQALDRRLAPLGPPHHVDDLGQGRFAPHPRRPEEERAVAVHRPADHLRSRPLLDRKRLSGQHRLVHR